MQSVKEYTIEYLRGLERDGSPLPGDRDPMSAYLAQNCRIGHVAGTVEKFGGRSKVYTSTFAGGALPGHVLGLTEARLGSSDHLVACVSTNDLSLQAVGSLTYSAGNWTFTDIRRTTPSPYNPQCPVARRFSFAVLNDSLIMTDFGVSALEKWGGSESTAALTIGGSPGFSTLKARYMSVVRDVLFLGYTTEDATAQPDRIRWSDGGNPESWTSTNFFDLSTKDGDIVMGLIPLQGLAVAFKRKSIWVGAYVGAPDYYTFEQVVPDKGTVAPFAMKSINNYILFASYDGIYIFDGSPSPRKISGKKVSNYFLSGLNEEEAYQIIAYVHPFKSEIWFCSQKGAFPTWVYNYETDDWYDSNLKYQTLSIGRRTQRATWNSLATEVNRYTWDSIRFKDGERTWDKAFNVSSGALFLGGASAADTTQAVVYEVDIGSYYDKNSSTTAMTATYRTNNIDCGLPQQVKRFLGATLRLAPLTATLTVRVYVDGVKVGGDISVSVASDSGEFGETKVYFNAVGVNLQLEIENSTAAQAMRVMGYIIHYVQREPIR